MSTLELQPDDIDTCTRLAAVLIPATATMPAITSLPTFEGLLRTAIRACGYDDKAITHAIESLPAEITWDRIARHARENAEDFHLLARLVSAAYYMAPPVLEALSYPVNRRHPARADEFADEFDTGILDPVMERDKLYRDPRAR